MPKINNCKYVLRHKPTGQYANRKCSGVYFRHVENNQLDPFLTPHINDCRVFTNKSTAKNSAIFQYSENHIPGTFELVPVTLVIIEK